MPSLNRYASSNSKSGYFVRANVGGSHPVTLQTTDTGERIFRDNDYSDGSTIPTKLVWSMYDVDLLYTESSLSTSTPSHSFDSLSDAVNGSNLTEGTRKELVEYFNSYVGSHQKAVSKILEDLRQTMSIDTVETYDISKPAESARSFFGSFNEESEEDIEPLIEELGDNARSSLLTFAQRAPQLEEIEITEQNTLAYHFTPLSVSGDAIVYDLTVGPDGYSDREYDYRIEYRDYEASSVYVRDGEVGKINGPEKNLSQAEAQRLAEELSPVQIDLEAISSTVDAPAISELDIPDRAFTQGDSDLLVGVVDRVSNSDNPLVEMEDGHMLLDFGKEDGIYLINRIEPTWGRVLCELSPSET
ncbi:hypothetical protein [Halobacterium salinarum]|uniref:hypothetical protein n=1 Tax=Halobacterium salinarum TaxID=2242 RepID=UPI0025545F6F|nr:hypothetical protein [Halobacterium salinarum]MDL0123429.1 hypothetical protein [Halobacterium salinarum]